MTLNAPSEPGETSTASDTLSASLGRRIRATFLAPSTLPRLLRPTLPWLDVLLISTIVAIVAVAFVPDEVFLEPMRDAVSRRGEPVDISSSPDTIARWGRGMGMLATLATHPVVAIVLAGVFTLLFATFPRAPAIFRDYLAITSHAMLIPALGTVLAILVGVFGGDWSAITSWTGGLGFVGSVLATVDPFVVWMLIVVALTTRSLDPRQSLLRSVALLILGYLILLGASAAFLHPELI